MDAIADLARRHGIAPERALPLSGALPCADGAAVTPHLCLAGADLWLLGADRERGVRIDVLAADPLRYTTRRLGDTLTVGAHVLGIPRGRGHEVKLLLATARFRRSGPPHRATPDPGAAPVPLMDPRAAPLRPVDTMWLAELLAPGEPLLAWLETDTHVPLLSSILGPIRVPWRFYMTDTRAGLVAISPVGDVRYQGFAPGATMTVRGSLARTQVHMGGVEWRAARRDRGAYEALACLAHLTGAERLVALVAGAGAGVVAGAGAAVPAARQAQIDLALTEHLIRLAVTSRGPLQDPAREARRVLAPGGLTAPEAATHTPPAPRVHALPPGTVEAALQHPAARDGRALALLQGLLARAERPDRAALTAYCERPGARHQDARAALRDAAVALGVPGIEGYLSRGDKAIGARAYEGRPPFLVLGARHLDPSSEFAMSPAELRFLVGAEVAHLRFGHTRVTSDDVWLGAWEHGKAGLDLLFTALPGLRGIRLVDRLGSLLDAYRIPVLGKALERAGNAIMERRRARRQPGAEHIAPAYEDLLAAHRAMQLTADRAGLLLCGDLRSAIRAMFLSRAAYRAELPVAEHYGLATTLARSDHRGEILFQELAIRVAALVAFSLSPEHRDARHALHHGPAQHAP